MYHTRTKHAPGYFARSLGYLEWANQPVPFRIYEGAEQLFLERVEPMGESAPSLDAAYHPGAAPAAPLSRASLSQLLYDSLAISAWKQFGSSRWALRCNPSSGNLHPTEAYLILDPIEGLAATTGVFHYAPSDHALELCGTLGAETRRALFEHLPPGCFFLALTSIHWRESWKYGERAYRYCQHDIGHAIGAVAFAAAVLGWRTRIVPGVGDRALGRLLGVDRQAGPEAEQPDVLLLVGPHGAECEAVGTDLPEKDIDVSHGAGQPNRLSPSHHPWPIIDDVHDACVRNEPMRVEEREPPSGGVIAPASAARARYIVRTRRSAVAMDGRTFLERDAFLRMMMRLVPDTDTVPFAALPWNAVVHPVVFVHRVRDLEPGIYGLVRAPAAAQPLRKAMRAEFLWQPVPGCPDRLPLFLLHAGDERDLARHASCDQDIAGDGCFALAMLADFEASLSRHGAWFYRAMHWEAGVVGQVLYLEAEAAGVRGTGIGCFYDDVVHAALGIAGARFQSIYHFTVGGAVEDRRLQTLPAYAHLENTGSGMTTA